MFNSDELTVEENAEMTDEVINKMAAMNEVATFVRAFKVESQGERRIHEDRWLRAYDQNRGRYSMEERASLARLKEKNPFASEAFIRVTKTKALAAIGQIEEIIFSTGRVPIGVEPTPVPQGIAAKVHIDVTQDEDAIEVPLNSEDMAGGYGYHGDGNDLPKGASFKDLFGGMGKKWGKLLAGKKVMEGDSPDPVNAIEIEPAKEAAKEMDKLIQDQLLESDAAMHIRNAIWEFTVLGTGVIKGPFTYKELCPRWEFTEGEDPKFKPEYKLRPYVEQVPVWNIYPDPKAQGRIENMDYVIHEHRYTRSQLQRLRKQKGFDKECINLALRQNYDVVPHTWDAYITNSNMATPENRWDIDEYWGVMPVKMARAIGIKDITEEYEEEDDVQVCVWVIGQYVIKAQRNPFLPERIPFLFINYEKDQYSIWGTGVPENMEDSQRMINVHTRMAQDNLRLAGSCMLEINETSLAPNQDNTIYAGKVWRKQGGAPGQAVYSITFNNTSPSHVQFITAANQWADQSTGIPSYQHGQTGIQSIGRTSSGLSMLMSAGNLAIRTVIRNIDEQLLKPLGEALFQWNMQFNTSNEGIRGDYKIVAKGTSLLLQREVQSQRILQFLSVAANPVVAPHVNIPKLVKDLAVSLDLDSDDVVLDMDKARMMADILGRMQNANIGTSQQTQGTPNAGIPGGLPPSPDQLQPADSSGTGGSNIGIGTVSTPGQAQFSGNS